MVSPQSQDEYFTHIGGFRRTMAIDDNTTYELTGYQVKDLAGRIRRKAEASEIPTSISDLGQVTSSDIDWSTITKNSYVARTSSSN